MDQKKKKTQQRKVQSKSNDPAFQLPAKQHSTLAKQASLGAANLLHRKIFQQQNVADY